MNLLISEILDKVSKLKTKKEKVAWLKQNNSDGLRMVIKSSFDPKMKWLLPEGDVPFNRNDAQEGTEHQTYIRSLENYTTLLRVVTLISHKINVKTFSYRF